MVVLRHCGSLKADAAFDDPGRSQHARDVRYASRANPARCREGLFTRTQGLLRAWRRGRVTTTRTRDKTWTFSKPFMLKGVDRMLPAGEYRVSTDEELIEGLSFPVYRRVATMMFVSDSTGRSLEMI